MSNKTLFDAVDAELRNARAALSNAGFYLDKVRESVDAIVKSEGGEYIIPLELGDKDKDESIVIGLPIKSINIELERELLQI